MQVKKDDISMKPGEIASRLTQYILFLFFKSRMRPVQFPAICTFSALIAFFGVMDLVRSAEVVIGRDFGQMELAADFPCNPHQEEGESEKESKSGEENESKESKKKKASGSR